MGVVWAVRNERTGGEFALKVVAGDAAARPNLVARLLREARAAGGIRHRNVVEVYDVGEMDDGSPFLIMQRLRGPSLESILQAGPLDMSRALHFAVEIGRGLDAAHAQGVVHRDLKPANVILHDDTDGDGDGESVVKVLDFGVSKFDTDDGLLTTQDGVAIGTPSYMSPEQARGRGVDQRSDLWALGVVLLEMLTGTRPFDDATPMSTVVRILEAPIPLLSEVLERPPPGVTAIIHRCLSRDPAHRPRDAAEVVCALESELALLVAGKPIPVSGVPELAVSTLPGKRYSQLTSGPTLALEAEYAEQARGRAGRRAIPIAVAILGVAALAFGLTQALTSSDPSAENPAKTPREEPSRVIHPAADVANLNAAAPALAPRSASSDPEQTVDARPAPAPTRPVADAQPQNAASLTARASTPPGSGAAAKSKVARRVSEPETPRARIGALEETTLSPVKPAKPAKPAEAELEPCTPESLAPRCFGGLD